jgi:hypothetical protein
MDETIKKSPQLPRHFGSNRLVWDGCCKDYCHFIVFYENKYFGGCGKKKPLPELTGAA